MAEYCGSLTVATRKTLGSSTPISYNIRENPIFANLQQATMQIGKWLRFGILGSCPMLLAQEMQGFVFVLPKKQKNPG